MSKQYPNGCDCCQDEHIEEEPAPIRLTWQTVPAANEAQTKAWMGYLNQVYDQYPGRAIPMMTAISLVGQMIPGLRPENYEMVSLQIEKLVRESPGFEIRKGKSGGLFRKDLNTISEIKVGTLPAPIHNVVSVAINNHTCGACGNTKCSKDERSCWKCGASLT